MHAGHRHRSERADRLAARPARSKRAATRSRCSRATRRRACSWDPRVREPGARRGPRTAATPSSTSPARTSPSAGTTTRARRIRESRELGTRNLVAGHRAADARPQALDQRLRRRLLRPARRRAARRGHARRRRLPRPGLRRLGARGADRPRPLGLRVVRVRTGVVLDETAARWPRCCRPFKLGVGGPVAGGDQYMPWIHADDVVGIYLAALDGADWSRRRQRHRPRAGDQRGVLQGARPALHRPAFAPVPGFAIRLLYGDMAEIVTEGQRAVPAPRARARLPVPPPGPGRGAARSGRLVVTHHARADAVTSPARQPPSSRTEMMPDLPPDLDRLGNALTTCRGAPRRGQRTAAGLRRRHGARRSVAGPARRFAAMTPTPPRRRRGPADACCRLRGRPRQRRARPCSATSRAAATRPPGGRAAARRDRLPPGPRPRWPTARPAARAAAAAR